MSLVMQPAHAVRGRIQVPGDKSISHRYAILAALAQGTSRLTNYAPGADCQSTLTCLAALGVSVDRTGDEGGTVVVTGRGLGGLQPPAGPLDCGNSGTTMRLMAGVLAAHRFEVALTGDASLSRRPMRRVMTPLAEMGARLDAAPGDRPPLKVYGGALRPVHYRPEVPSAQVKSAVLLAGVHTPGTTSVTEPAATRDHTERALEAFGAPPRVEGRTVSVSGGRPLQGRHLRVPGDISSAAFPAAAAAALPGSEVTIEGVGLNPSRSTTLLAVLRRFGARIDAVVESTADGEPVGRLHVGHGTLVRVEIAPAEVPEIIDELPVLAALATVGGGLRVTGAGELRVKESDRITALVSGLRAMGADADELPDGFDIRPRRLTGGSVDAHGDHRLAMAFAVAALGATGPTAIAGAEVVAVSYPSFFADLDGLRA